GPPENLVKTIFMSNCFSAYPGYGSSTSHDRCHAEGPGFRFPNIGGGLDISGCPEVVDMGKSNNNCHQRTAGGILTLAEKAKRKCRFDRAAPCNSVVEG